MTVDKNSTQSDVRKYGKVKKTPFLLSLVLFITMELLVGGSDGLIDGIMRMCACFLFTYCIFKGMQEEFVLNPYILFSITPLSLLLYSEKISTFYLQKLNHRTWFLALINMLAFIVALNYTSEKRRVRLGNLFRTRNQYILLPEEMSNYRTIFHTVVLCCLGVSPVILGWVGIKLPFKSVISFFLYIGIMFALKSKKKSLIVLALGLSLFNFVDDFNKTRLLYIIMTVLCGMEAYYIKDSKDRAKVFCSVAIMGAFMLVIAFPLKSFMRSGGDFMTFFRNSAEISASSFTKYYSKMDFKGPQVLQMPYMYLVSAWNNVQYVMETQPERTYGLWTIKPLLGYLQLDGYYAKYYELTPYSSFNTYTYITVLFKDFGYFGSVFGSLFLGYYVKKVYNLMKKNGSVFGVAAYALVAMATLEMFFSNHFYSLSYPFTILLIGWLYKILFRLRQY